MAHREHGFHRDAAFCGSSVHLYENSVDYCFYIIKEKYMAIEKGAGSLQLEKSGRWTMRVGIKGKRYSGSTSTSPRG